MELLEANTLEDSLRVIGRSKIININTNKEINDKVKISIFKGPNTYYSQW
jgi:hypothetical protein